MARKFYRRRKVTKPAARPMRRTKKAVGSVITRKVASGPFGNSTYMKNMVYQAWGSLNSTAGAISFYTFRLNSCYDPDFTGIGNQPRYYDTMCGPISGGNAPYGIYRVYRATISCVFNNPNAGTVQGYVAIRVRNDNSASVSGQGLPAVLELPNQKWKMIGLSSAQNAIVKISYPVSIAKLLTKKDLKDDESTGALYNANPANQAFADIWYIPSDGSTSTIRFTVKITYDVLFTELTLDSQSLQRTPELVGTSTGPALPTATNLPSGDISTLGKNASATSPIQASAPVATNSSLKKKYMC